ncbi:MAG: TlpA family protein disulfide reductase [Chlorobiales bacterium]|nr:TlpA family protein disulfide reductase [Chlorobiales bacterium]
MVRAKAPLDSILTILNKERTMYPNNYDAHTLYWSLYYEKHGRTPKALAQIEDEMTAVRHDVGDNTDLLQAYALTYIHGIGDRRKAYEVTKDIPDAYLHPINLHNRFLIEPNPDNKEMSWLTMTEEYPGNPLTGKMTLSLLLSYMTNPEVKTERTAILAESIFNKRLSSLRSSGVVSYAVRFLFDFYGSINLEKAMPYIQDVLRMDYERDIYDEITLLQFADRLSTSADYSGMSIDIANKALQSLEKGDIELTAQSIEKEFIQTPESKHRVIADLKGRAYYVIGKAYLQSGNSQNGLASLLKAEPLCYAHRPELLLALAKANANTPRASSYATQILALEPTEARLSQISRAVPKLGKSSGALLSEASKMRVLQSEAVPSLKVQSLDGQFLTEDALRGKTGILYFWSPNAYMSRTFFSNLQLIYSKYRSRGVELICIDTDGKLADLKENPGDYSFTYPFVTPVSDVVKDFGVSYLPTVVIVQNGRILYRNNGYSPGFIELLEAQIRTLVPGANVKVAVDGKNGK